ncbi:MAG: hypothetical protein ACI8RN_002118 [Glaciecola sp.]|jgi:hypothetical protein|uniref:hypothetical protein n=1 Tax=Congregibacter sp. TaxID=2744308 RepID=UPI0039E59990
MFTELVDINTKPTMLTAGYCAIRALAMKVMCLVFVGEMTLLREYQNWLKAFVEQETLAKIQFDHPRR